MSQSGNKKTVDMDIAGPGGQLITTELPFEYLPDDKKIVYNTVNNPLFDTQAVYQLSDEGASTFIDYHQNTHMLQSLPVPDGVIKQVIRGIFVAQLEDLEESSSTSRPPMRPTTTTSLERRPPSRHEHYNERNRRAACTRRRAVQSRRIFRSA